MGIKLKWAEDIINGLSNKAKKAIITALAGVFLTGGGGGAYLVFAKASVVDAQIVVVDAHLAMHEKDEDKKRRWVLEEQMLEYREMFEDDLDEATEKQKKRYRKWDLELDDLYKKLEERG